MSKSYFNIREALEVGTDKIVDQYKKATPGEVTEAPEDREPASPDEAGMAMDQAKFIGYVAEEIMEYIQGNNEFPEWMQNKLSALHEKAKGMHAVMAGKYNESVEVNEAMDQKKFSAGAKAVKSYAQKNGGIDKKDFMEVSKLLDQIGRVNILQAGQLITRLNRLVDGMDTDVRERIYVELKKVGLVEAVELDEKFSPKEIKMAIGVASDKRYAKGNMTGAVKAIEKIAKGLSNHKQVAAVLKRQNEDLQEAMTSAITIDDFFSMDSDERENLVKLAKKYNLKTPIEKRGRKNIAVVDGDKKSMQRLEKELKSLGIKFTATESFEESFKPHMMYDPKTGKAYKAEKPEDHERMAKMGYSHEKPDMNEKLKVSDGMAKWIEDFQKSDAPQFKGKDKNERKEMAIAAYLAAKRRDKKED